MTRAKAWLSAIAALVVGGVTWQVAVQQAREDLGMTCEDLEATVREAEQRPPVWWFVGVADGFTPPKAFAVGDPVEHRTIGEIEGTGAAGHLVVEDDSCGGTGYRYEYKRAASVANHRVYALRGDRYFARSWFDGANLTVNVKWLGGWKDVKAACLSRWTAVQCRSALGQVSQCWRLGDGTQCRDYDATAQQGRLYGPGVGGVNADGSPATCVLDAGALPIPCDDNGEGPGAVERMAEENLDATVLEP
jgi:hypothetical protein